MICRREAGSGRLCPEMRIQFWTRKEVEDLEVEVGIESYADREKKGSSCRWIQEGSFFWKLVPNQQH